MAIDPNVTRTNPESNPASAIENEIPAYRAISPLAIYSLILGALSILSFAPLVLPEFRRGRGVARLPGRSEDRPLLRRLDGTRIRTGGDRARADLRPGVGDDHGGPGVPQDERGHPLRRRPTRRSSRTSRWRMPSGIRPLPSDRKKKTGDQIAKEMKEGMPDPDAFEMQTWSLRQLKTRLEKDKDTKLRFSKIESHGVDGLTTFAAARPGTDRARCEARPRRRVRHGGHEGGQHQRPVRVEGRRVQVPLQAGDVCAGRQSRSTMATATRTDVRPFARRRDAGSWALDRLGRASA